MSEDFKLEMQVPGAYVPTDEDRVSWIEQIKAHCYPKLNMWDQDFITDVHDQTVFSMRQRAEVDRIWDKWKGCC